MPEESKKPAESLVQELLAERRNLMVANERLKLELADAKQGTAPADTSRTDELRAEIGRLRQRLDDASADLRVRTEERDALRDGIAAAVKKLEQEKS